MLTPPLPPMSTRLPFTDLRRKIFAGFGSAVLVLVVGAAGVVSVLSLRSAFRWVEHTYQVIGAADNLLMSLTNAETGQRGYLLTGEDRYLDDNRKGRPGVDSALRALRQLTMDNATEQNRVKTLTGMANAKLAELDTTILVRRTQGLAPALAIVVTDRGRNDMVAARELVAEMKAAELSLLAERTRRQYRNAIATLVIIGAGSVAAFMLAVAITQTIRVDVEIRERDREHIEAQAAQLRDQAAELESQQVELEAQTEDLKISNDYLQSANSRAERALRAQRIALVRVQRSNEELDQFAYVASHDLKAPLRGISNLATWLEEDLGPAITPTAREHMTLLRGRVQRMEALIDGILQYSRAGRIRTEPEHIDVGALLREIVELLDPPPDVTIQLASQFPVLQTDRVPLQQVFLNLIGNAIKYTRRAGATIRVGATDVDGTWEFSVADNGPGIAAEYHDRIFGIFQTLEARDKIEGTGIGLSVVKKIVEARGGRVTLASDTGTGATFTFTWPELPPEEG